LSIDVRASDVRFRDYLVQLFKQRAAWLLSAIIMSGASPDEKAGPASQIKDGLQMGLQVDLRVDLNHAAQQPQP
jgi:hypothetical protein